MSKQNINIGSRANDGTGDTLRVAGEKINANFTELYSGGLGGSSNTLINGSHTVKLDDNGLLELDGGYGLIGPLFGPGTIIFSDASGQLNNVHSYFSFIGTFSANTNNWSLGFMGTTTGSGNNVVGVVNTYNDSTASSSSWTFDEVGDLYLPTNGGIVFDRANTSIRVGMGFHVASGEGINLQAIDQNNNYTSNNWYFSPDGTSVFPNTPTNNSIKNQAYFNGEIFGIETTSYNPGVGAGSGINFDYDSKNVTIQANTRIAKTWTFAPDGTMSFPSGGYINDDGGPGILLTSDPAGVVNGTQSHYTLIQTNTANTIPGIYGSHAGGYMGTVDNGSNNVSALVVTYNDAEVAFKNWSFNIDGSLTLPNGTNIGSDNSTKGITLTTNRGTLLVGNTPERIGSPQHFHIMADTDYVGGYDKPKFDLFFGSDFNYVQLPGYDTDQLGVNIATNNLNGGAQYNWRFGTDGTMSFPSGGYINDGFGPGIQLSSDPSGAVNGIQSHYSLLVTNTANTIPGFYGSHAGGFMGTVDNGSNNVYALVTVYNDTEVALKQWQFNIDGSLTLPGSIVGNTVPAMWNEATTFELDVTATINKIAPQVSNGPSQYHLANGVEGQIMYLVPANAMASGEYTSLGFDNARYSSGNGTISEATQAWWLPFHSNNTTPGSAVLTLIFTDGAWNLPHNSFD